MATQEELAEKLVVAAEAIPSVDASSIFVSIDPNGELSISYSGRLSTGSRWGRTATFTFADVEGMTEQELTEQLASP